GRPASGGGGWYPRPGSTSTGAGYHPPMQVDLRQPWRIGSIEIPTRLVLAPMAGVSVQAFRRQGRRFGAGLVCSEMVSCAGIGHRSERTLGYLRVATDGHPLAIQIFGSDPSVMADAARMVETAGADLVDINFGCPVRKVTKTGAGATLLEDPDRAARIVAAVAGAVDIPVSVKMRRGLENGSRACLEVGTRRASGFLKKFYGWYLGRGRFPRPFKQELVQLATTEEVELRLFAAAPGAAELVEQLEAELPAASDDVLLDMPISIYGGG